VSDCHELPDETIERVKGVDVMILNCLRERQHPTHLSLERALGYLDLIAPKRAYLVHMCHDLTHEEWLARLAGTNVEPAYDGLELNIGDKP
jgi:phosphoribosyl 1,2-cyclic phosphate phosphodiesterase